MDTAAPKRKWRNIDLAGNARDDLIRRRLVSLWTGDNGAVLVCLFAGAVAAAGHFMLWPDKSGYGLAVGLYIALGIADFVYLIVRQSLRPTTTAIDPAPGPGASVLAVVAVELSLIVFFAFFGDPPLTSHLGFLVTVLFLNGLLVAWLRAATGRLRARVLADPELPRILAEAVATIGSSAHRTSRAPHVAAQSEAQRASPHQDLAAGRRARRMSWLWGILAVIGFGAMQLMINFWRTPSRPNIDIPGNVAILAVVVIIALGIAGGWLHERADRRRKTLVAEAKVQMAPSAQYALQKDQRPPILLLRSFVDDAARNGAERFEESIAPWLSRYGPLVAIGDPGDTLPDLGAYRDYVADHSWQERARTYIKSAAVIVMIPGKTHWIQWELSQILDGDCLHKTAFVFPPGLPLAEKTARLAATWQAFAKRNELQPLRIDELAATVVLHFFAANAITRVTDPAFADASHYTYDKALFAAFTDR